MTANPWATPEQARNIWADAPLDDDLCQQFLDGAYESCVVYAPALADDADVPVRYTQAVVMQAREVYQAGNRDSSDVIGFGDSGFAIRVRPLSQSVKQLLRPRSAVPKVG